MNEEQWVLERQKAIHLLRSGKSLEQVSQEMRRSIGWVHKWQQRYQAEGWRGLSSRSRQPHTTPNAYPSNIRQQVCQIRSELEAQTHGNGLCFIGAPTIRMHLLQQLSSDQSIPSIATIERILTQAGLTRPKAIDTPPINYPCLSVTTPHHVHQLDIVPHHLAGGQAVACFNALDVFSRYPTGQTRQRKTSQDAMHFLLHMWRELGIATYTQMDNEGCFTGGNTHRYVIGKVVRLCLMVGTQPIFIPIRHPKTNAIVERFHQTYDRHIWNRYYLDAPDVVNQHAAHFFDVYRHHHYHSALDQQTPQQRHQQQTQRCLPHDFSPTLNKLPITEGQVHFIRKVESDGCVPILNHRWTVSLDRVNTGIWATLQLETGNADAILMIYDDAPDALSRRCLAHYYFPLPQPVVSLSSNFATDSTSQSTSWSIRQLVRVIRQTFTMF